MGVEKDLEEAEKAAKGLGIAPEQSSRVMELREKLAKGADLEATADEVYSHLLTFFSRYYQCGDFLGLQRSTVHGREKYMIPYNGEEVKLIWANMDQYYIKSSELLRDYTFHIRKSDLAAGELKLDDLPAESVVRFELIEGDTEKDNRKPDGKTTRAFALDEDTPFTEDGSMLAIRFRYREHASERNLQDKLNADTEKTLADSLPQLWKALLLAADPTYQLKDKKDTRSVLQKHLRGYTAKFSFDYFIHKDLGGVSQARAGLLRQERGHAPRRHRGSRRPKSRGIPLENPRYPPLRPTGHPDDFATGRLPEKALAEEEVRRRNPLLPHPRPRAGEPLPRHLRWRRPMAGMGRPGRTL